MKKLIIGLALPLFVLTLASCSGGDDKKEQGTNIEPIQETEKVIDQQLLGDEAPPVTKPIKDEDGDGIADENDNCPKLANENQSNVDGDELGDLCDPDNDNDGIADGADNCFAVANADQLDTDKDGQGDACDLDDDGDGILDEVDNCPVTVNTDSDRDDLDNDGVGDLCDSDKDGDGVNDDADNCPLVSNPDQKNLDKDKDGDVCDNDRDGDGVSNDVELRFTKADGSPKYSPDNASSHPIDIDGDGLLNEDDDDQDGDGFTAVAGDCDDRDGLINPKADDSPLDDKDENCDGIPGDAKKAIFVSPNGDDADPNCGNMVLGSDVKPCKTIAKALQRIEAGSEAKDIYLVSHKKFDPKGVKNSFTFEEAVTLDGAKHAGVNIYGGFCGVSINPDTGEVYRTRDPKVCQSVIKVKDGSGTSPLTIQNFTTDQQQPQIDGVILKQLGNNSADSSALHIINSSPIITRSTMRVENGSSIAGIVVEGDQSFPTIKNSEVKVGFENPSTLASGAATAATGIVLDSIGSLIENNTIDLRVNAKKLIGIYATIKTGETSHTLTMNKVGVNGREVAEATDLYGVEGIGSGNKLTLKQNSIQIATENARNAHAVLVTGDTDNLITALEGEGNKFIADLKLRSNTDSGSCVTLRNIASATFKGDQCKIGVSEKGYSAIAVDLKAVKNFTATDANLLVEQKLSTDTATSTLGIRGILAKDVESLSLQKTNLLIKSKSKDTVYGIFGSGVGASEVTQNQIDIQSSKSVTGVAFTSGGGVKMEGTKLALQSSQNILRGFILKLGSPETFSSRTTVLQGNQLLGEGTGLRKSQMIGIVGSANVLIEGNTLFADVQTTDNSSGIGILDLTPPDGEPMQIKNNIIFAGQADSVGAKRIGINLKGVPTARVANNLIFGGLEETDSPQASEISAIHLMKTSPTVVISKNILMAASKNLGEVNKHGIYIEDVDPTAQPTLTENYFAKGKVKFQDQDNEDNEFYSLAFLRTQSGTGSLQEVGDLHDGSLADPIVYNDSDKKVRQDFFIDFSWGSNALTLNLKKGMANYTSAKAAGVGPFDWTQDAYVYDFSMQFPSMEFAEPFKPSRDKRSPARPPHAGGDLPAGARHVPAGASHVPTAGPPAAATAPATPPAEGATTPPSGAPFPIAPTTGGAPAAGTTHWKGTKAPPPP